MKGPAHCVGLFTLCCVARLAGFARIENSRTVLGITLSACHNAEVRGAAGYGVFRM